MSKEEEQLIAAPVPEAVAIRDPHADLPFGPMQGVLMTQETPFVEWLIRYFIPGMQCLDLDNSYFISAMPDDKKPLNGTCKTGSGWSPGQGTIDRAPHTYTAKEYSECCLKFCLVHCGIAYSRRMRLDIRYTGYNLSYFEIKKHCRLGGVFCCPHRADIEMKGETTGRIIQDWNWSNYCVRYFESLLCCREHYRLQVQEEGEWVNKYNVNVNKYTCGPHLNLCGSTACCNSMLWNVVDRSGHVQGRVQKVYGSCYSCNSCARAYCCAADNYIVSWEEDVPLADRAMFMSMALMLDYINFERSFFCVQNIIIF